MLGNWVSSVTTFKSQYKSIIFPISAPQQLQLFRKVSFQSCNVNSFLSSAVKAAMWTKFFTALESEMQVDRVRQTSVQKPILQNTNKKPTHQKTLIWYEAEWVTSASQIVSALSFILGERIAAEYQQEFLSPSLWTEMLFFLLLSPVLALALPLQNQEDPLELTVGNGINV